MNSDRIKKFETILESVKVPSNMGIEQQKQLMTPINVIVEDMLPSRLYRFREYSEQNFDAFYYDTVMVSAELKGINVWISKN